MAKIYIQRFYSFKKKSKITHSFIKSKKLFNQQIYSLKKIQNYSFKENIHSSEKWIIAQGYGQITSPCHSDNISQGSPLGLSV